MFTAMNTPDFRCNALPVAGVSYCNMGRRNRIFIALLGFCLALILAFGPGNVRAAETLVWQTNQNRVTADITSWQLPDLLEQIAAATGWQVYVEPGTTHRVSAKFKALPPGDALRLLLGDLNFALVPQTDAGSRLFVFRTSMHQATQRIQARESRGGPRAKIIANELIVRLKPGADINDIARALGARVIGHIPELNAYRLQFDDAESARDALASLIDNPDVTGLDANYVVDRPTTPQQAAGAGVGAPKLQLRPPEGDGRIIIGLIDTAMQPFGSELDAFFLKQMSVVGESRMDPNVPSHGTAMAESILRGIEKASRGQSSVMILPVDVYGNNANSSTWDVSAGIVTAVNNGANTINLSLGSYGQSPMLGGIIEELAAKGIAVFAAAGNQPVTTPFYPAAYPGATAVTATTSHGQIAHYANRGDFVDLGAPGNGVVHFNGQTFMAIGTSSATAFTTGMGAGYMDSTKASMGEMNNFLRTTLPVNTSPVR
jgi:hypothetical protein